MKENKRKKWHIGRNELNKNTHRETMARGVVVGVGRCDVSVSMVGEAFRLGKEASCLACFFLLSSRRGTRMEQ